MVCTLLYSTFVNRSFSKFRRDRSIIQIKKRTKTKSPRKSGPARFFPKAIQNICIRLTPLDTHTNINTNTYTHTSTCLCLHLCVRVFIYACVCVYVVYRTLRIRITGTVTELRVLLCMGHSILPLSTRYCRQVDCVAFLCDRVSCTLVFQSFIYSVMFPVRFLFFFFQIC